MATISGPAGPIAVRVVAAGLFWTTLVGCSRPTTVAGVVTLDGRPLPAAVVQFFPVGPEGQTAATQTDSGGRYQVNVSPHPMCVTIRAQKVVGQVDDGGSTVDIVEELVPERYRDPASAVLKVEPRQGASTTADFALTSGKK